VTEEADLEGSIGSGDGPERRTDRLPVRIPAGIDAWRRLDRKVLDPVGLEFLDHGGQALTAALDTFGVERP